MTLSNAIFHAGKSWKPDVLSLGLLGVSVLALIGPAVVQAQDAQPAAAQETAGDATGETTGAAQDDTAKSAGTGEWDGRIGQAVAGIGYSSDLGGIVSGDLQLNHFLADGQSLALAGRISDHTRRAGAEIVNRSAFDGAPVLKGEFGYSETTASDIFDFGTRSSNVKLGATWPLGKSATITGYGLYSHDEIYDLPEAPAPVLARDEGERDRTATGFQLSRSVPGGFGPFSRAVVVLTQEFGGFDDGRGYSKTQLSADGSGKAPAGLIWNVGLRAGALASRNGPSYTGDRFFLGPSTLRGFEFGGFGPHDPGADGDPALGGERYAVLRLDLQRPGLFGLPGQFVPGVFADAGSLWQVRDANASVSDGADLRASVGISMSMTFPSGALSLELAKAVAKEDGDRTRLINLAVTTRF